MTRRRRTAFLDGFGQSGSWLGGFIVSTTSTTSGTWCSTGWWRGDIHSTTAIIGNRIITSTRWGSGSWAGLVEASTLERVLE